MFAYQANCALLVRRGFVGTVIYPAAVFHPSRPLRYRTWPGLSKKCFDKSILAFHLYLVKAVLFEQHWAALRPIPATADLCGFSEESSRSARFSSESKEEEGLVRLPCLGFRCPHCTRSLGLGAFEPGKLLHTTLSCRGNGPWRGHISSCNWHSLLLLALVGGPVQNFEAGDLPSKPTRCKILDGRQKLDLRDHAP